MLEKNTLVFIVMQQSSRDLESRVMGVFLTEELADNYINNHKAITFFYIEKHILIGEKNA